MLKRMERGFFMPFFSLCPKNVPTGTHHLPKQGEVRGVLLPTLYISFVPSAIKKTRRVAHENQRRGEFCTNIISQNVLKSNL